MFFTCESVSKGHPDKVCDQISDAVLDAYLKLDKNSRVACETVATTDYVLVMGEITSKASVNIEEVVRETVKKIGYTEEGVGFKYDTLKVDVRLKAQSADIALGVDSSMENKNNSGDALDLIGAGDQGMMFGYATNETEEMMPLALILSHKLCKQLDVLRESGKLNYLLPDGKAQVTIEYENGLPKRVDAVVLSTQHKKGVELENLRADLMQNAIKKVIPANLLDSNTKYYINPTGRFEIGGPQGDSGLTGRKIIVDTYGGMCAHGGGCFSGKDPTKVDRSGAYMARYIAKNIVASGLANKCEIQIAYAIGVAKPVSVMVNSYGTGKLNDLELSNIVQKEFDLRPAGIINTLELKNPIYSQTSAYGHFGKSGLPWEKLDKVNDLKKYL